MGREGGRKCGCVGRGGGSVGVWVGREGGSVGVWEEGRKCGCVGETPKMSISCVYYQCTTRSI